MVNLSNLSEVGDNVRAMERVGTQEGIFTRQEIV
jgi:hypothetical protein